MTKNYHLVIESKYLGRNNCADELYIAETPELVIDVIMAVCRELIKIDSYRTLALTDDDLIVGLDTGPYNFVFLQGNAFYVDFYPPRHRINAYGTRLDDFHVITDYPAPRNEEHGRHLLYCLYTRSGLWMHGLSHLLAAVDSNIHLQGRWTVDEEEKLFSSIYIALAHHGTSDRIEFLKEGISSSRFKELRSRYYNHRTRYYHQNQDKGFNLGKVELMDGDTRIRKYYLADKQSGRLFSQTEGEQMLENCRRYYDILKNDVGMRVPSTRFELVSFDNGGV